MIATPFRAHPAAAAAATLAVSGVCAVAALAGPTAATAQVSDAPCDTSYQLALQPLHAKIHGRSVLIGKLYVFDEGRNLCAVTTSVGTKYEGVRKFMRVTLSVGGKTQTDQGQFSLYAGRIRLPDKGCFSARGTVTLAGGQSDDEYASCVPWRNKPMP
ncbi:MAG TPA: hypothetical protein VFG42_09715 [Baekduia sp.]|uniref:hypothetical protein n=1 Tax=Baekduia sp. TaxID=2600305 RepID=UPI002D785F1D|nr:hypothetical protein [Baekduia sp.]HET6507056.1 hypothetical protein [Baekduia sp.]